MILTLPELRAVLSFISPDNPQCDFVYIDINSAVYAADTDTAVMLTAADRKGPPRNWHTRPPGVWRGSDLRVVALAAAEREIRRIRLEPDRATWNAGRSTFRNPWITRDRPAPPLHELWPCHERTPYEWIEGPPAYGIQARHLARLGMIGEACQEYAAFARVMPSVSSADRHLYECVSGTARWSVVITPRLLPSGERP